MESKDKKKKAELAVKKPSRKPHPIGKKLNRNFNTSDIKEQVKSNDMLREERRNKMNENFSRVKKHAQELQKIREHQNNLLLKSLELAELNRKQHIEQRRAASKKVVERVKTVVLQNKRRSKEEQGN